MDKKMSAKLAMLDLLVELKRICDKNDINYFLIGGTLIGAIRHNGFIPWDDDIDVGMLRSDYDRFLIACKNDLKKEYSLENFMNDEYNPNVYHKLKIKKTVYVEALTENINLNKEIFIDVFPFDNVFSMKIAKKIGWRVLLYRKILAIKCGMKFRTTSLMNWIIYYFITFLSNFMSKKFVYFRMIKLQTLYNRKSTDYVINYNGAYSAEKEMCSRLSLEQTIEVKFEGIMFKVPKEYDSYLKHVYGDYMKLPPLEERRGKHSIVKIDLGNYQVKSKIVSSEVKK